MVKYAQRWAAHTVVNPVLHLLSIRVQAVVACCAMKNVLCTSEVTEQTTCWAMYTCVALLAMCP